MRQDNGRAWRLGDGASIPTRSFINHVLPVHSTWAIQSSYVLCSLEMTNFVHVLGKLIVLSAVHSQPLSCTGRVLLW